MLSAHARTTKIKWPIASIRTGKDRRHVLAGSHVAIIGRPIYEQFTFILSEVYRALREAEDSHFKSFPKLFSRTGKLPLLPNWPIECWTAVYNEVSSNVRDQRVI